MSRNAFYYWIFFSLPILYYLSIPIGTGDLAVWVAQGNYFLLHGEILRHDIYSVLSTKELVYPFGACVLYALIYGVGGLISVSLFHKLILFFILIIWKRSSLEKLKETFSYSSLLVIFIACLGSCGAWVDRPALLGYIPFILSYLILKKDEELSGKDIIYLNLINVVWVNIHGTWLILSFLYVAREVARCLVYREKISFKKVSILLSFLITSLVNPFGHKVFNYVYETISISKMRAISEWDGPFLTGPNSMYYVLYFFLLFFVLSYCLFHFVNSREKFNKIITSPFIPVLLMGIHSVRNTVFPFLVLLPFACDFFWDKGEKSVHEEKKSWINIIIIFVILACGVALFPTVRPSVKHFLPESLKEIYSHDTPLAFLPFLNATKDNHALFNSWEYGSALILLQKHPIFLDTRNIIYTQENFEEYVKIMNAGDGWEDLLGKYKIHYILLGKKDQNSILSVLNSSVKWESIIVTKDAVLFQRKDR